MNQIDNKRQSGPTPVPAPALDPVLDPALAALGLSADGAVRRIVMALTRRGAYLLVTRDEAALFSDRNDYAAPLAMLDIAAFQALVAAGWVELSAQGTWLLAKTGRDAVRRARSGADAAAPADPDPVEPPDAAAAAAAAAADDPPPRPSLSGRTKSTPERVGTDRDSPLTWLHRRRDQRGRPLLSDQAYDAGERLRADFWFAAMTPRITASWSPVAGDSNARRSAPGRESDMPDNVLAAKERVRRALAAVGPELSGILIDVCCHEKGIEAAEREVGWPVRSGRIVLQLALERLARHYGLRPPEQAATWVPEGRIRAWGGPGYRPGIDGQRAPA
jgi:hypothetical protein